MKKNKIYKSPIFWFIMVVITMCLTGPFFLNITYVEWFGAFKNVITEIKNTFTWGAFLLILFFSCMITSIGLILYNMDIRKNRYFRENLKKGDIVVYSPPSHISMDNCEVLDTDDNMIYIKTKVHKSRLYKPKKDD